MNVIRAAVISLIKKEQHDSEIRIQRTVDNVHTDQKDKQQGKKIMAKKFNFLARMKTKALGECALRNNKVVDNKL